ncbi:hypothetical protein IB277_13560 [Ensifer sp. ENS07]|uniref:hypothetical protein n=1 Tax=unclassified Ensifer TaxID=2633371 RepID=UPI00177EA59C|nr:MULTISPECIES: hypothetical protein [unclassified Ensifer]MBD9508175.1 hypothetical protein [Ensifer sp. ENS10]MBD9637333.1 hypothetical protein [Ensifer sp. ENS07]
MTFLPCFKQKNKDAVIHLHIDAQIFAGDHVTRRKNLWLLGKGKNMGGSAINTSAIESEYDDERIRFHQAEVFRFSREGAAEELLLGARSALSHENLPSSEVRFRPCVASRKRWWPKACSADLYQMYVDGLNSFDGMVRKARQPEDLAELTRGLLVLIEAANAVGFRGWEVNWRQNVQWALRGSRYGLSGYSLVERYENLADRITLSERLEIIGGPIFYTQKRRAGKAGEITPDLFAGETEQAYGAIFLSLNRSVGRRYRSDWIVDGRGGYRRLLSD